MEIHINGSKEKVLAGITVIDLIKNYKINPKNLIIEINNQVIHHQNYAKTVVQSEDKIELIRFIGGG